jgi:hypothetical protein
VHNAGVDSMRRAHESSEPLRGMHLEHASRLSKTFAVLVECYERVRTRAVRPWSSSTSIGADRRSARWRRTPQGDAPMRPFKRPHRWTGRPKGPPPGSQNRLTHGLKTAASKARRRAVNALPRAARAAIREAT